MPMSRCFLGARISEPGAFPDFALGAGVGQGLHKTPSHVKLWRYQETRRASVMAYQGLNLFQETVSFDEVHWVRAFPQII